MGGGGRGWLSYPPGPGLLWSLETQPCHRCLGWTVPSHRRLCGSLSVTKNPGRDFIFKPPAVGAPRGAGRSPSGSPSLGCAAIAARPLRAAGLAPSNPPWFNLHGAVSGISKNGTYFERKRMWRRKKRIASGSVLVPNNALLLPQG